MNDDDRTEERRAQVVDMTAGAIDRRLRDLGQLYRFAMELKAVNPLGKARDLEAPEHSTLVETSK